MFAVVQRKQKFTIHKKRNYTLELLVVTLLVTHRKSKGYMLYCPNGSPRIAETGNAKFPVNGEVSGSVGPQVVEIKVKVLLPVTVPSSRIDRNILQ